MASSSDTAQGMTLYQAARRMGVHFTEENAPSDRYVDVNGLNLHYLEWGDAANPTLLMLHGRSQQAHSWDFVSLALSDRFHVLALDQRGHGDSDWATDGDYSIEAQQGDIDGFVEALRLDGFVLIGHSMGGRNAYVWAGRHPQTLKGLMIVDTGPETGTVGLQRMRVFRELPDELDSFEEFARRVQQYTGRSREQTLGALKYSIRRRPDGKWTWKYDKRLRTTGGRESGWTPDRLWDCVAGIACPTTVLRGSRSDVFLPETLERMQQVIPDCAAETIPGAGHLVQGDNPAAVVASIRDLLRRVA